LNGRQATSDFLEVRADRLQRDNLPPRGPSAAECFLEYFAANIRNPNTRLAYARAVRDFFRWTEERGPGLSGIRPLHVATYIEGLPGAAPSVKQKLAAIRMLFDWLVCKRMSVPLW